MLPHKANDDRRHGAILVISSGGKRGLDVLWDLNG